MSRPGSSAAALRDALKILRRESPDAYQELNQDLGGFTINCQVGAERFCLAATAGGIRITANRWRRHAEVEGRIAPAAIFQLADGGATLIELLFDEAFQIRGHHQALLRVERCVRLFLESAVRSVALTALFESYRSDLAIGAPPP